MYQEGSNMEILTLGNKIKKRRKELGLTLKELAGNRVTPAQLSYVETDKCRPSLDLLEYVSEKLGLEMDYLLESEKQQVSRFCELNIKISKMDIVQGNISDAEQRLCKVVHISESNGLLSYLGQAQRCLGQISQHEGRYEDACQYYLKALQNFSKINDCIRISETFLDLGNNDCARGHISSSIGYFKQAEQYVEDAEILMKIKIYVCLMTAYGKVEDWENALNYAQKASSGLESLNNINGYLEKMICELKKLENEGKVEEALKLADKTISVFEGANTLKFIGTVLAQVGCTYLNCNRAEESLMYLTKALEIKLMLNDGTLSSTYAAVGRSLALKKDFEEAFEKLNEALNISIKTMDRKSEAQTYYALFQVYNEKEDFIKAEESIRRCGDILESIGANEELAQCYIEMADFYQGINREKQAANCISKALDIYNRLGESPGSLTNFLLSINSSQ